MLGAVKEIPVEGPSKFQSFKWLRVVVHNALDLSAFCCAKVGTQIVG